MRLHASWFMAARDRARCACAVALMSTLCFIATARAGETVPCDYDGEWEFIDFSDFFSLEFALSGLNEAGQVVGTTKLSEDAPSHERIFRWENGVVDRLDFPGMLVQAQAISEGGAVLGTVQELNPDATVMVLIWQPDLGTHELIEPDVPFWPADINDDLLVCGLAQDGLSGVVMDGKTGEVERTQLGAPPREPVGTMGGMAINESGTVAGQEVVFDSKLGAFFERPFMWTASEGVQELPLSPGQVGARAVAINEAGDIVGTVTDDDGMKPVHWPAGAAAPIAIDPPFGYFVADAHAVNVHQHIGIVAPNDLLQFTRAFIWTGEEYVDLDAVAGSVVPGDVARITHLNSSCEALIHATEGFFIVARGILRPVPDSALPGDLNDDDIVDEDDRAILCAALGSASGEPGYVEAADMNDDDAIDQLDQQLFNDILPPCAGDIVTSATFQPPADGVTDGADLAFLLGAWASEPSCADMVTSESFAPPPDGIVDGADLAYLLGAWGGCK